ncbi:MAG: hypothetical protein AD742_08155 [Methylibium sp. NZG]|nr:MAG: hypothetical protein AD742_08155 [Methylibium sp. NZG]
MNVSKLIVSSVAAVPVVGAIGLAYAQTTTQPAPTDTPSNPSGTMTQPTTPASPSVAPMPTTPMPATPDTTTNSSGMSNEREAQIDRN